MTSRDQSRYSAPFGLLDHPARGTSAIALPRIAGMAVSFVLSVVLARWLGLAELGTYTFVLSWVVVLATTSLFGLDRVIVRDLPVYRARAAWGVLRGSLRWATGMTVVASVTLTVLAFAARRPLASLGLPPGAWLFAGLLVPLTALARVQQSTLRGFHHRAWSQVPETVLQPLVMLVLVTAVMRTRTGTPTAGHALIACTAAVGVALGASVWLVRRALPAEARVAPPRYQHRVWLANAWRMSLLTGLAAVGGQIDVLALGIIGSPEAVGAYAAALRGAGLIPLALNMSVIAMAPTFAGLHAAGERDALQRLLRRMSRLVLLGGVPVAVGMILAGRPFLLLFGPGFESARTALTILSVGQLVNIAAGPVATLLAMTGHERDATVGVGVSLAANGLLCLFLIPRWGMNGAAIAAASSMVLWNVVLWWFVWRRLAITPTILGGTGPVSAR